MRLHGGRFAEWKNLMPLAVVHLVGKLVVLAAGTEPMLRLSSAASLGSLAPTMALVSPQMIWS